MTLPKLSLSRTPSGRLEVLTPKLLTAVASERNLYGALAALAQGFLDFFGAVAADVRVLCADGRTLDLVSACGLGAERELPNIDLAAATPAAWAVRKRSIQFVSVAPGRPDTLFSLPLVGDERVLGAVSGRFNVPLASSDCEHLADLGPILGALIEIGLLSPNGGPRLELPQARRKQRERFLATE